MTQSMVYPCTGPWFSVEGKNEKRGASHVSYLRKLYVTVNGITVTLMKGRTTLVSTNTHIKTRTHTETKLLWTFTQQVNGRRVALPHTPSPLMTLSLAGQYVTVQTSFGLRVRWDGNHYAQITVPRSVQYKYLLYLWNEAFLSNVINNYWCKTTCFCLLPSSYFNQMCGLCGDYNDNPGNDFTKPDGSVTTNVNDFGNSWKTEEDEDDLWVHLLFVEHAHPMTC